MYLALIGCPTAGSICVCTSTDRVVAGIELTTMTAICGTTFVLLFFFLDVHDPRTRFWEGIKAIDWAGSLSILAVTLMLLLGLDFGGKAFPWDSPKVICLLVFGGLAIILFFISEKKLAKYPLMPLLVFRNRSNVAALVVTFVHGMVS